MRAYVILFVYACTMSAVGLIRAATSPRTCAKHAMQLNISSIIFGLFSLLTDSSSPTGARTHTHTHKETPHGKTQALKQIRLQWSSWLSFLSVAKTLRGDEVKETESRPEGKGEQQKKTPMHGLQPLIHVQYDHMCEIP